MPNKLNWLSYLDRLPGKPNDRQIARAASADPSTITRWRNGQDPNPRHAVAVAREYGLHPLPALLAAGYLSTDEVDTLFESDSVGDSLTLSHTPTIELIDEVARRIRAAE